MTRSIIMGCCVLVTIGIVMGWRLFAPPRANDPQPQSDAVADKATVPVLVPNAAAAEVKWGTIKGRITWNDKLPNQPAIVGAPECAGVPAVPEDYIINPKNAGMKNVFVWLRPAGSKKSDPFPEKLIHPDLRKISDGTMEVSLICCTIVPHAFAVRDGQRLAIKNNSPFVHNVKWDSAKNGIPNPVLKPGETFEFPKPLLFEPAEIQLVCTIHGWMKAHFRVFDHPYFALTDSDGNFEIKNVPVGDFSLFVHHPATGWLDGAAGRNGKPITIKGDLDVGELKMKQVP